MPTTVHLTWNAESGVTFKVEYKKHSDSTWTVFEDAVTENYADIPGLDASTSYDFRITAECPATNATPTTATATTPGPTCPAGYTLSEDGSTCYKVLTTSATQSGTGSTLTACHFTDEAYSNFGGWIFKLNGYNQDGTYTTGNEPTHLTTDPLWVNADPLTTTDGRLNKCGLWVCGNQTYNSGSVGFSRSFYVDTAKVYYVGMGADNRAQLTLNGTLVVDQGWGPLATQFSGVDAVTFKNWFIYPIQLEAGPNVISMTAVNDTSVGIMGVEIYNATEAQLVACTNETDLEPYILFSTKDITDNSDFEVGNWYCSDPSYTLVYDPGTDSYSCQKTVYTTPV